MKHLLLIMTAFLLVGCSNSESQSEEVDEEGSEPEEPVQEETEEEEPETEEKPAEHEQTFSYEVHPETFQIIPLDDADPQVALLTIDDAPDQHAVDMAHILNDMDIKAIFFVNGMFLQDEAGQNDLKAIYDMGFEIGNHTMTHPNLEHIDAEQTRKEIVQVNDLVEEITGERPRFFRAPFGVNTDASVQVVAEENMTLMNWTYGYDWEAEFQQPDALADIMVNTEFLSDGANLLMHDREWTAEALSDIVAGLEEKGYEIVDPKNIESVEAEVAE